MPLPETVLLETRLRELGVKELILKTQIASLTDELTLLRREVEKLQDARLQLVNPAGVDSHDENGYTTRDVNIVNRVATTRRRSTTAVLSGSIKEDALRALRENPDGLLALDVLAHINGRRDHPVQRTSLSPQLSRLRQAGLVSEEKSVWRITPLGLRALLDIER